METALADQILGHRQFLVQAVGLEDDPHPAADPGRVRCRIQTRQPNLSAVGLQPGAENPEQGGLAGPVGPQQPQDPAAVQGEADPVQGLAVTVAEGEVPDLDEGARRGVGVWFGPCGLGGWR